MKRILVIEDESNIRETLDDILQLNNYETQMAKDGEEGLMMANELSPDLIICDIMMPKKNGLEVLRDLAKQSESLPPPFIFLTAKSDYEDIRLGMNLGADDYLLKPFKMQELLKTVERNLLKRENMTAKALTAERDRISTFLHDGVQQLLVIGHLNLSRIKKRANFDEKTSKMLDQSAKVIAQAIEEMRSLSHELVEDKTLEECINQVCLQINQSANLKVRFHGKINREPGQEQKLIIYNVVQEALNNILKHAGATTAHVKAVSDESILAIEIEDNGNGFDESVEAFGIKKMRTAIIGLNGHFELFSTKDKGTKVTLSIPLFAGLNGH